MSLTDVMCKKAQPQEKQYRLSDTNGLSLRIDPNGKKYWSIRYTENGQRKSKALGIYPELSLKRAREIALDLRYKLKNTVEVEEDQPCFKEVAEDWFNNQKETWSSNKFFCNHLYPSSVSKSISLFLTFTAIKCIFSLVK